MPDANEVEATEQIQFNKADYVNHDDEVKQAESHGWKDWDDHIENGGDPEKWVSPEVFNERGRYQAEAQVSDEVLQGVIVSPVGYWPSASNGARSVNVINDSRYADLGRAPTFSDTLVEVRRAEG